MTRKMQRTRRYGVKFIGYGAYVFALGHTQEVEYAIFDFVSGTTILIADDGFVIAPKHSNLATFVNDLPCWAPNIRELLKLKTPDGNSSLELMCGDNTIRIKRTGDVDRFIGQIAGRYSEIEQVLEQTIAVGSKIKRRPYDDYIDEIGCTGSARVEFQGYAVFADGHLEISS